MEFSKEKFCTNALNYKRSLDRIIEKYSKLEHQEDAIEVDLSKINQRTLKNYMLRTAAKLDQMEDQSLTDSSDESMTAHGFAEDAQLDFSHSEDDEEDGGTTRSDTSQLAVSVVDLQPEDQDIELEMSLKSNTNLMELYPSMVSQLEWAQHRHNVFEAADLVLRKYRKLRQLPQRSHLNNTYNASLRCCKPKNMASVSSFMDVCPQLQSPLRAQQWSPGRGRSPQRIAPQWPILARDLADSPHTFKPQNCSVNETFSVPVQREPLCSYYVSPPRFRSPAKHLSLPHIERAESYSSPSRQSPFKPRKLLSSESSTRSPKACSPQGVPRELVRPRQVPASSSPHRSATAQKRLFPHDTPLFQLLSSESSTRSPKACSPQGAPRELVRPRQMPASSSPHSSATAQKRLFPQDTPLFQSYLLYPQSSIARGDHRLSRHLSLDASLPSSHTSYSTKDLDEDLNKLFHRFVCQGKYSFLSSVPCRYCAKNPEANKNPSSSSLAALALSPLRTPLRKRVWDESVDSSPGSKRYRHDSYASSPGSKRHNSEMLRRFNAANGYYHRKYW